MNETAPDAEVPAGKKKPTNLTFSQKRAVFDALSKVCTGDGVNAQYQDDHDDHTVAASMPFPCTVTNVATIRRTELGNLFQRIPNGEGDEARDNRLSTLERAFRALCGNLGVDADQLMQAV